MDAAARPPASSGSGDRASGRASGPPDPVDALVGERLRAGRSFFDSQAERIARLCHRMAQRFARGGRLLAVGISPQARSDARHVAVEFVHPVIVGKRALPALGLTPGSGPLSRRVDLLARPDDMLLAFGLDEPGAVEGDAARGPGGAADAAAELAATLGLARERGCLTVAFPRGPSEAAEWSFDPPSDDPFVRQELVETLYHVVWELVHVFFEHRGLLEGRDAPRSRDVGASSFLYPFLGEGERDLDAVLDDVRRSVLMKSGEVAELRRDTVAGSRDALEAAAAAVGEAFGRGGALLALGNGGSATDAMDLVADLVAPLRDRPPRPALDLTEDASILTAVGNDVGMDSVFSRQVIAHGSDGDVLVAFSTSGGSRNVIEALVEARKRGLGTVAFVGYDGGTVAAEGLADHVVVSPSEHVPRIQEAQATAYHLLTDMLGEGP